MVDGVHKDAHILDHRDAVPALRRLVQQLVDVKVGRAGVHLPLGDHDEGFAAAVLRQAEDGPRVALGQAVVQNELPLVPCQLQKAEFVGQRRLCHPQPLGRFGLGAVPQDHHVPQALCLLKWVQVCPLQIFEQAKRGGALVGEVADDGWDGPHLRQLAGAEPPLPRDQLIAAVGLPHRDGLQQTVFPDALGQPRKLLLIEGRARLIRRGMDVFHRELHDLSSGSSTFKHKNAPFTKVCACFQQFLRKRWKTSLVPSPVYQKTKHPARSFVRQGVLILSRYFVISAAILRFFHHFWGTLSEFAKSFCRG